MGFHSKTNKKIGEYALIYTDIVGSTKKWEKDDAKMANLTNKLNHIYDYVQHKIIKCDFSSSSSSKKSSGCIHNQHLGDGNTFDCPAKHIICAFIFAVVVQYFVTTLLPEIKIRMGLHFAKTKFDYHVLVKQCIISDLKSDEKATKMEYNSDENGVNISGEFLHELSQSKGKINIKKIISKHEKRVISLIQNVKPLEKSKSEYIFAFIQFHESVSQKCIHDAMYNATRKCNNNNSNHHNVNVISTQNQGRIYNCNIHHLSYTKFDEFIQELKEHVHPSKIRLGISSGHFFKIKHKSFVRYLSRAQNQAARALALSKFGERVSFSKYSDQDKIRKLRVSPKGLRYKQVYLRKI